MGVSGAPHARAQRVASKREGRRGRDLRAAQAPAAAAATVCPPSQSARIGSHETFAAQLWAPDSRVLVVYKDGGASTGEHRQPPVRVKRPHRHSSSARPRASACRGATAAAQAPVCQAGIRWPMHCACSSFAPTCGRARAHRTSVSARPARAKQSALDGVRAAAARRAGRASQRFGRLSRPEKRLAATASVLSATTSSASGKRDAPPAAWPALTTTSVQAIAEKSDLTGGKRDTEEGAPYHASVSLVHHGASRRARAGTAPRPRCGRQTQQTNEQHPRVLDVFYVHDFACPKRMQLSWSQGMPTRALAAALAWSLQPETATSNRSAMPGAARVEGPTHIPRLL